MREYRFQGDDDSTEAFRRLRGAWRDFVATDTHVVIRLADGGAVRLEVDRFDIEPGFAATCLVAELVSADDAATLDVDAADRQALTDLGLGGNDVVLFTGATWIETASMQGAPEGSREAGLEAVMQRVGHPGEVPAEAEAVCITHDAAVIASPVGTGCLVRIASVAGRLEVVTDRAVIAAFLTLRGYDAGTDESAADGTSTGEEPESP